MMRMPSMMLFICAVSTNMGIKTLVVIVLTVAAMMMRIMMMMMMCPCFYTRCLCVSERAKIYRCGRRRCALGVIVHVLAVFRGAREGRGSGRGGSREPDGSGGLRGACARCSLACCSVDVWCSGHWRIGLRGLPERGSCSKCLSSCTHTGSDLCLSTCLVSGAVNNFRRRRSQPHGRQNIGALGQAPTHSPIPSRHLALTSLWASAGGSARACFTAGRSGGGSPRSCAMSGAGVVRSFARHCARICANLGNILALALALPWL